ncbi:MAG: ribulose-phosphate 3-epimerase [Planctomycetota bacterium]
MIDLKTKPARPLVLPSILAADFTRLGDDVGDVLDQGAEGIHVDIMDGHFVPNLSMGPPVMASLRKRFPEAYFDVHLMVTNPEMFVGPFADAGADHITFHIEATAGRKQHHEFDLIEQIKAAGCTAGVCFNPPTTAASVQHLIGHVEMFLAMSVHPGFGGQKFIPDVLEKIRELTAQFPTSGDTRMEIDGGVGPDNAAQVVAAGVDMVVAGSAVFGADDRAAAIAAIHAAGTP